MPTSEADFVSDLSQGKSIMEQEWVLSTPLPPYPMGVLFGVNFNVILRNRQVQVLSFHTVYMVYKYWSVYSFCDLFCLWHRMIGNDMTLGENCSHVTGHAFVSDSCCSSAAVRCKFLKFHDVKNHS